MNLILLFLITLCAVYEWLSQLAAPDGTGVSPRSVKASGGISLSSMTAPNRALILCCLCANTLQTLSYLIKFSFLTPFYRGANLSLEKLRHKIGARTQVCLNPKTTAKAIEWYSISLYLCAQQTPLTAQCDLGSGRGWPVMVIESVVQTLPIITHTLQMWKQRPWGENKPRVK